MTPRAWVSVVFGLGLCAGGLFATRGPWSTAVSGAPLVARAGVSRPAAQATPGAWVVERVVSVLEGELLDVATTEDGGAWLALAPYAPQSDYAALRLLAADGSPMREHVARDEAGRWLQPLAVAPASSGGVYAASADALLALDGAGDPLWHAPAGDGRAGFGPAARALVAPGSDGLLYGLDLANARVLGYEAGTGTLRRRLGTAGVSPGSYLGPRDIARAPDVGVGPDATGRLWVADFGNRRLQQLDTVGNPLARLSLPAAPVALDVAEDGTIYVALDDDRVLVLAPDGRELGRLGGHGAEPDRLHTISALSLAPDGRLWVADRGNARLVVYRPAAVEPPAGLTPPVSATPPVNGGPFPTPLPTPLLLEACPGEQRPLPWRVELSAAPARTDLVLAFDTTGSMEGVVSVARSRAFDLSEALAAAVPDLAIAVLDVRDYPYGEAGASTDLPWRLRGRLRPGHDYAAHRTALSALRAGGGGDAPEAYAGALSAALADERMGWRDDARRILVLIGDSVPRDDDLNEGIVNPAVPGVWTPGRPAWWRDSGRDWAPGSGDDIDWQAFVDRLAAEQVTLLSAVTGAAPTALGGSRTDLTAYWQAWAERTPGGSAQELDVVSALPERLAEQVADVGRVVQRLEVGARPAERASWVSFDPPRLEDVVVPPEGRSVDFEVRLDPPPGTVSGVYPITLTMHADGGLVGLRPLWFRWSELCPGTATPVVEATPTVVGGGTPTSTVTPTPSRTSVAATSTPIATFSPTGTSTPVVPTATSGPTVTATSTSGPQRVWLPAVYRRYCDPKARPSVDVALVLDSSSSMAGEKLAAARDAAAAFLDVLALPRDHAAVITFDEQARLRQWLTGERPLLELALLGLRSAPGTRIDRGLEAARRELLGARGRGRGAAGGGAGGAGGEVVSAVVLLTDGRPDGGREVETLAAAERVRSAGIEVFTIGLGGGADGRLLERVAGDPGRYFEAAGAGELAEIYVGIAGEIGCR